VAVKDEFIVEWEQIAEPTGQSCVELGLLRGEDRYWTLYYFPFTGSIARQDTNDNWEKATYTYREGR
jgi:hypothetical protein